MIVDQSSKSISNVAGTIERVKAALEETEAVLESVPNEIKGRSKRHLNKPRS